MVPVPPIDLPPRLQERVMCSIVAASTYEIPADVLLAVAEKEGGRAGQWVRNRNGTHDVGVMQFNTAYLEDLGRHGIRPEHVAAEGCYPYKLAAWRLRMHIRHDEGDLWTRAANYHSRTPTHNAVYRADLIVRAQRWGLWLQQHYPDVKPAPALAAAPLAQPQQPRQSATLTPGPARGASGTQARPVWPAVRLQPDVPRGLVR